MPQKTSEPLRTFLAMNLPEEVCTAIHEQTFTLRKALPRLSWVRPGNFHLTLHFFGETPSGLAHRVSTITESAWREQQSFELAFSEVGTFPANAAKARVLWLGISDGREELERLVANIGRCLRRAGLRPDAKPFKAHLTLARIRESRAAVELAAKLEESPPALRIPGFRVESMSLLKSEITNQGSIYAELSRMPFKPTQPDESCETCDDAP